MRGKLYSKNLVKRAFEAHLDLQDALEMFKFYENDGLSMHIMFMGDLDRLRAVRKRASLDVELMQGCFDHARKKLDITQTSELLALIFGGAT